MKAPFIINNIFRKNGQVVSINIIDNNEILEVNAIRNKSSTRSFIKYKEYIIKFDVEDKLNTGSYLYNQCQREFQFWNNIGAVDKKYFSEIVYYDSEECYIIQKLVRFKRGKIKLTTVALIKDLSAKYGLEDIVANNYNGRIYKSNWGVTKNGPVIFDYAI